jgi:hypothetical protein
MNFVWCPRNPKFLEEEQRLRVEAEIQQAVERALDAAGVPALVADEGLDEGGIFRDRPVGENRDGLGQTVYVG